MSVCASDRARYSPINLIPFQFYLHTYILTCTYIRVCTRWRVCECVRVPVSVCMWVNIFKRAAATFRCDLFFCFFSYSFFLSNNNGQNEWYTLCCISLALLLVERMKKRNEKWIYSIHFGFGSMKFTVKMSVGAGWFSVHFFLSSLVALFLFDTIWVEFQ